MRYPVALTHPTNTTQVSVERDSPRFRRLRLAGWTETLQPVPQVSDIPQPHTPTPPAWLAMPDPDLDYEAAPSKED